MTNLPHGGCHPYVNAWSDEHQEHPLVFRWHEPARDVRLTYLDPVADDWHDGFLLARYGQEMTGVYEWKTVNTWRQYRCMIEGLCQNCGESAADEDGLWWAFVTDPYEIGGYSVTNLPPTCKTCIPRARKTCPRLRARARICTIAKIQPYAVWGDLYKPALDDAGAVRAGVDVMVPYTLHRLRRYCLAKQLIVSITGLQDRDL